MLGALVVWFLIGPANTQRINRQADEKVVEYSGKMASQEAQLNQLQSQVDSLNETTASAQQQIQTAQDTAASYENLLKAVEAQQQGNTIYKSMQSSMFQELSQSGVNAFDDANYTEAIDKLSKAKNINDSDYTVLNYLAHAYRLSGDTDNAILVFQEIIDKFPGTQKATKAEQQIDTTDYAEGAWDEGQKSIKVRR